MIGRKRRARLDAQQNAQITLRFAPALAACAIGAAGHLLLDLLSGIGAQLLWPFHSRWFAWDLTTNLDPWILLILLVGLLMPQLFRLVSEEIGDRKKKVRGRGGAITALILLCAYFGVRACYHSEAVDLLLSREFRGREPLSGAVFPFSSTPFDWRGVAVTETTIEEVDVPLGGVVEFDPDRSVTHFKPDDTAALEAAQGTADAAKFLAYARFPLASVTRIEDGFRVEIRDVRFGGATEDLDNIVVRVNVDSATHVTKQEFRFASDGGP